MNLKILKPTVVTASAIRATFPIDDVDLDDNEFPRDFPGLTLNTAGDGGTVVLTIGLDDGKVHGWPAGRVESICVKVVDDGVYELLDHPAGGGDPVVLWTFADCVPDCLGDCDYIELNIQADGSVKGWEVDAKDLAKTFF